MLKPILIALVVAFQFFPNTSDASQPNVLFIVIDDLNDWVGPLGGHPQVKTPAIDALAARGTTFTNAHCQAPLCNPSRVSFLLSLRPSNTGLYALNPSFREVESLKDSETIFQHFSKHGYTTYSVGKIFHNGYRLNKSGQYDKEVDFHGPLQSPRPMPKTKISGKHPIEGKIVDWGSYEHDMKERCDWKSADWTIRKLKNHSSDSPFFMACGFYLPHVPIYTTQKWHDLYPIKSLKLPTILENDREDCSNFARYFVWSDPYPKTDWLKANNQLKPLVQSYLAAISFTDFQVSKVLKALKKTGQDKNTIIVLFSDHGFHCGEKGVSGKHTLWEESTRVPLIFSGPGVKANSKCAEAVELLDIYPTLTELCGLETPKHLDGLSLVPQIQNPCQSRNQPAICTNSPNSHSVRDERWRFIQYADGSRELYDCMADPNEHKNLINDSQYLEVIKTLSKWLPEKNATPVPNSLSKMVSKKNGRWYYQDILIEDDK